MLLSSFQRFLLALTLLVTASAHCANAQTTGWAKSFTGTGFDLGSTIAVDAAGNVYTAGQFEGTMDFDPGVASFMLTSAGQHDAYVVKQDRDGALLWAGRIGSTTADVARGITISASGHVYITGFFTGSVDFDPGAGTAIRTAQSGGAQDVYVVKLDTAGAFVWVDVLGGNGNDGGQSVSLDNAGNIYIAGYFDGSGDFDPGPGTVTLTGNSWGGENFFITKLTATGAFFWAKAFSSSYQAFPYALATDISGAIYACGFFSGTIDFDPGSSTFNLTGTGAAQELDAFVIKLDASGVFSWAKQFGGVGADFGHSVGLDPSGNVYVAGTFVDTADFDPGPATSRLIAAGLEDAFILKLNPAGDLIWSRSIGGPGNDWTLGLTTEPAGGIYAVGLFQLTADFDPGPAMSTMTSAGDDDAFVLKLSGTGALQWARRVGDVQRETCVAVATDAAGSVYTTGHFAGNADFDPGTSVVTLNAGGSDDPFVLKLTSAGALTILSAAIAPEENLLTISPTPCWDMAVLRSDFKWSGCTTIRVLNFEGAAMLVPIQREAHRATLDVRSLVPGVYLVEVVNAEAEVSRVRLVKQ